MIPFQDIQDYANKIAERFQPEKIILFGSYAYGTPNKDSDVDLLVLMNIDGRGVDVATDIRIALYDPPFPLDLLVRTPKEVKQRIEWQDFFLREVVTRGVVLYDAAII